MKVAIYTTFNEDYLETGATMIYSFLQNNTWFDGDIFVLCDKGDNCKFSEDKRNILRKISDKIQFYEVNSEYYKEIFDNFPQCSEPWFKSSFYKIELLKKDDYDWKLYIDADVCFCDSIDELFQKKIINGKYFLCRDVSSDGYSRFDISPKTVSDYANLGFMLVNCSIIDENEFEKVFNFCKTADGKTFRTLRTWHGRLGEQDCLNECLEYSVMLPSAIYDCNIDLYDAAKNVVKIVHYYGKGRKPWDSNVHNNSYDIFYRNYFIANKIINS